MPAVTSGSHERTSPPTTKVKSERSREGAHHAVRHDVAHLGGLEICHHHDFAILHLFEGHKFDEAADNLRPNSLPFSPSNHHQSEPLRLHAKWAALVSQQPCGARINRTLRG